MDPDKFIERDFKELIRHRVTRMRLRAAIQSGRCGPCSVSSIISAR